ncbi:hypothetical protein FDP41_005824 [Naegleria fowleri]|uniref:DNA helicase n=1 Tax=Naegleria fowleri TaxID=5763 RepID=A0A6A5BL37_NAEFO|nr:uncharacterized protein FDP41_005824 [Naegleria fowleri]KAF0975071.1 hypothetical protein FDP41_005824 [Naegleria fowleri]
MISYDVDHFDSSSVYLNRSERPPALWSVYFPNEVYIPSELDQYMKILEDHFNKFKDSYRLITVQGISSYVMNIDMANMLSNLSLQSKNFIEDKLYNSPGFCIGAIEMAAHHVFLEGEKNSGMKINARIQNHSVFKALKKLKSNSMGKFVAVKGTVVKVSNIRPIVTQMVFNCAKCGTKQKKHFRDGKFTLPTKCKSHSCKSRAFIPDRSTAVTVDWQRIKIQEISESDDHEAGRIPRTIECDITEDLVESCSTGDEVIVCGTVKAVNTEQHAIEAFGRSSSRGNTKRMYFLYLEGNSITNTKASEKGDDSQSFSTTDLEAIREMGCEPDIFRLIVHSLCPAIFGHEIVKAGLVLTLFGGVQRYTNAKDMLTVRGDPHILIVGDPGLGKSQLLTAVSHIAPRGIYVCGNTTSTSGLTVTVTRDSATGDFSLEAGALVLADRGCCCIDEFDKMSSEHQALLEAMEQQSISVAKAGIVCNLPARCSVAAAANPVGGHYNRAKTVGENLKINPALLSRFDLIFILLDKPDELRDKLLSEHVLKLHSGSTNRTGSALSTFTTKHALSQVGTQHGQQSLKEILRPKKGESFDIIPPRLLRKYIAYARQYVMPKLNDDAKKVLQEFYVQLRKSHHSSEATPITTRQLESLIRLAQARARAELRNVVTERDALDVVELIKESMFDVLTDDKGRIDLTRVSGMSKTKQQNAFIEQLTKIADSQDHGPLFEYTELIQYAQKMGLTEDHRILIDRLNNQGYLLKKGTGTYKLTTCASTTTPTKPKARSRLPSQESSQASYYEE